MPNLDDYLTIKEAAAFLGVSPNTLRSWGSSGKLPEHRNPINGYRLFKIADLEELLARIESSRSSGSGQRQQPK
ncbi:MerR family transcriptional regulator [Candidatus Laterigemmans baculatus]|uniref:MerR family transcriptional regulator n=1 Tax=Candidatus Laterigemmans baculatus TaxID=2770505 RepID=UPI0013D98283|nr:helix-turn-helix domain-containing protein [Candidatus Laterigemmans baculatus]